MIGTGSAIIRDMGDDIVRNVNRRIGRNIYRKNDLYNARSIVRNYEWYHDCDKDSPSDESTGGGHGGFTSLNEEYVGKSSTRSSGNASALKKGSATIGWRDRDVVTEAGIYISPNIGNIFENVIQGRAHTDMMPNPDLYRGEEKGLCDCLSFDRKDTQYGSVNFAHVLKGGNIRKGVSEDWDLQYLWECCCPGPNRIENPAARAVFENTIIDKVLQKVLQRKSVLHSWEEFPFSVQLAFFTSGGLLAEQILLMRLIHQLTRIKAVGELNVVLFIPTYKKAVEMGSREHTVKQFEEELIGCLPPGIKLDVTLFPDEMEYLKFVSNGKLLELDIVASTDLKVDHVMLRNVHEVAAKNKDEPPIMLMDFAGVTEDPSPQWDISPGIYTQTLPNPLLKV